MARRFSNIVSDITITAQYELDFTNNIVIPPVFDPAMTDPAVTDPNLYVWVDAGYGVEKDGSDIVTNWTNLVNPEKSFTPGGAPLHIVRPLDNKPVIRFDGSSFFNYADADKLDSDVSVFAVFNRDAAGVSTYQRMFSSLNRNDMNDNGQGVDTGFRIQFGDAIDVIPREIYTSYNTERSLFDLSIGSNASWNHQRLEGDICEILVYDRALNDDQKNAVAEYLKNKWFSYNVTFDGGEHGTIAAEHQSQRVDYKKDATEPEVTIEVGWNLTGWSVSFDSVTGDITTVAQYDQDLVTSNITLRKGYNLVSLSVLPVSDSLMNTTLDSIKDELIFAMDNMKAKTTYDGTWVNWIGNWNVDEGYLIKLANPMTLSVTGLSTELTATVTLIEGINFVPIAADIDPEIYFASILEKIAYIRDEDGKTMRKVGDTWVNGIGLLIAGKSYIVDMKVETPFTRP